MIPSTIQMNPRYQAGLAEFKKRCTDYEVIAKFVTDLFVQDLCGLRTFLATTPSPCIADIGCGDGTITEHLLQTLSDHVPTLRNLTVIEPLEHYIEQTKKRFARFDKKVQRFTTFERTKAEEYFGPSTQGKFHLIFASHSLHLISLETVDAVLNSLAPAGFFVVIIGAKTSIMSLLKDLFTPVPAITGAEIVAEIKTRHPNSFDVLTQSRPSELDLSGMGFPENITALSGPAKNLISLMVQKNVDDVDQKGYTVAREMILSRSENSMLNLENDCLIFRKRWLHD